MEVQEESLELHRSFLKKIKLKTNQKKPTLAD